MKKKEKRLLWWGIGGLAALYFLTRPKTQGKPPTTSVPRTTTRPTNSQTYRDEVRPPASVGYPYRDATV